MAWSMPTTTGQWNPGIAVTPDLTNMGGYSAEQWTAMQQQNWQQWAQWQQQYTTWQTQYGSKYAEQMQALQSMGQMPQQPMPQQPMAAMPPLPPANNAPPPPPPDKPPPPAHENNQPLYGHVQQQPIAVIAPVQNKALPNNTTDNLTGNNSNRSNASDQASVNVEALRMLAEEEKVFDIQFQKWEDEIEQWKKANVNHPDKKAYEEYEQRFEACRARLLERRLLMKQKRAKLLGSAPQPQNSTNSAARHDVPGPVPLKHSTGSSNYSANTEPIKSTYVPPTYNKNYSQNTQHNIISQNNYRRENSKNFEPQDRHESYSNNNNTGNNNFSSNLITTEPFLASSEPPKGIPGLDLVPDTDKFANKQQEAMPQEVIDITDEPMKPQYRPDQQEPDYSKISKGINNILGDEKIMNILSMVRGQGPPASNVSQGSYGNVDSGNNPPNNYWDRNEGYNDNYGRSQNMPYGNQQTEYPMYQERNQVSKFAVPPPRLYNDRSEGMQQNQFNERNQQYNNQAVPPRAGLQQNIKPNMPSIPNMSNIPLRPLLDTPPNNYSGGGFERRNMHENIQISPNHGVRQIASVRPPPAVMPKWVEEPLFTPSIIVEYEHKPLRLKARDFIEPVHTFDYNHESKESDNKKKDFGREAEDLFTRNNRIPPERHRDSRDIYYRDNERNSNREQFREPRNDPYPRAPRDEYDDRRRFDDDSKDRRFDDRRRDDRDKFYRREDVHRDWDRDDMVRDRERERDLERIRARERERERDVDRNRDRDMEYRERERDGNRDRERDGNRDRHRDSRRSRSRDRDSRKRGLSKESDMSNSSGSKKLKEWNDKPKHTVMIDDILEMPGRQIRPEKIVIILRGPPGSGKSYLAKLIRDREAEQGGTVRVMSIDDYFMQEGEIEEKDPSTGKIVKKPSLKYEYDEKLEETYLASLKRAFKRSLTDGYFTFLIFDAVNDQLRHYADIWNFARQTGFQVYICGMDLDAQTCYKRNIHNRKLEDIEVICSRFFPTPNHHIVLDPTTLLQSASITEVQMEDADDDVTMEDVQDAEVNSSFTSKWEKMDDAAQLARLDGTSKPLRPSQPSMEDYLQLDDWKPSASKPGKKSVRWADIEERREQEKMRAIGFVVGQTDWNRMTDPTMGSSALTQTKYIERVRRT